MHQMVVRGPFAKLWHWLDHPEEAPDEVAFWGMAGASKSWQILTFLLYVMHRYPNVPGRILICRDTYNSLTRSACVTIRKILPAGHPMLEGPTDEHRTEYRHGAWVVTLSGLSEPSRLYSTEWDFVFVEEARETSLGTWEEFARAARNYALYRHDADGRLVRDELGRLLYDDAVPCMEVPMSMTILATNPDSKNHWILKRGTAGQMEFLQATIHDNPAYWDIEGNCLTPMGAKYTNRMSKIGGVRKRRLVLAEWCSPEGAVWPEFDTDRHVMMGVKRDADGFLLKSEIERLGIVEFYAGADFGYDNSGVLVVGGYTKARKIIIIAEVFHSRQDVRWWTDWLVKLHKRYPLTLAFCDHNRPDWILAWNDALGVPTDSPGAICVRADKGIDRGLEIVRRRLASHDNGPHLHVIHDALVHPPDPELLERHVAWRTIDCLSEYAYKRGSTSDDLADDTGARPDRPDKSKANSDGADAARYLCTGLEYFEPETDPLTLNSSYRKKLRMTGRRPQFEGDIAPDDDMEQIDEEDWIVDTIRRSMHPD